MDRARLYIENQQVEVDDIDFGLNLQLTDLIDFTEKKAFKTTTIDIPLTKRNRSIFNFEDAIIKEKGSYNFTARIESGTFIYNAIAKILGFSNTLDQEIVTIQLVSNTGAFQDLIKDLTLKDIDLSEFDHAHTEANINAATLAGTTYTYPLINLGNLSGRKVDVISTSGGTTTTFFTDRKHSFAVGYRLLGSGFSVNDYNDTVLTVTAVTSKSVTCSGVAYNGVSTGVLEVESTDLCLYDITDRYPALPVKTILEKLVQDQGYTIDINWLDSTFDGGLSLMSPRDFFHKDKTDKFELTASNAWIVSGTSPDAIGMRLDTISYGAEFMTWIPPISTTWGYYRFNAGEAGIWEFEIDLTFGGDSNVIFELWDNNVLNPLISWNLPLGGDIVKFNIQLDGTEDIYMWANRGASANPQSGNAVFRGKRLTTIGEDTFTFSDMMPEIKQTDFIKNIANLTNSLLYIDDINKEILFYSRDSFYSNTAQNWSNKLDTKSIVMLPYPAGYSIDFSYSDKSELVEYNEKKDGRNLVQKEIVLNTDLQDTLSVSSNELQFIGMDDWFGVSLSRSIPSNLDRNLTELDEKNTDVEPFLVYYESDSKACNIWRFMGVTKTSFPYAYTYDFTQDTDYNLYWDSFDNINDITNNGLIDSFYSGQNETLTRARVVEAYFNLTNSDISNMIVFNSGKDFRTPIYIDYDKYKGFYYVSKIENYQPNKQGLTKVELIEAVDKDITL